MKIYVLTDRQTDRQTDHYTHSNNRPDILVYDSETGFNVELDVALAHPWASDIFRRAATTGEARQ